MDFSEDSGDHPTLVFKGKRSKRSRQLSLMPVTSTSSIGGGAGGGGAEIYSSSTPTTSATLISSSSSEEDEDMANCLILLAQSGYDRKSQVEDNKIGKMSSRKFREVDTKAAGLYVYECKTCNRSFPSFQALGGHRTSHKKAKTIVEDKKSTADSHDDHDQVITTIPSISHNKPKIHECSICGAEFSSGQALGGHMRRHRPPTTKVSMSATCNSESSHDHDEIKQKSRIIFSLDLNLPAPPEDDHRDNSKFDFSANKETLVFSAATLVDCHY